jgi:hypothetical protein
VKDEIVWAKMKFFSAWPAKVSEFNFKFSIILPNLFFIKGESQFQSKGRKLLKEKASDAQTAS